MVLSGPQRFWEEKSYKKGDYYYIPSGVVHSAVFSTKVFLIDYFEDRERYKPL